MYMPRKVEIEERALLQPPERDRVLQYMHSVGNVAEVLLTVIHYTTDQDTVEIRVENGVVSEIHKSRNTQPQTIEESAELHEPLEAVLKRMADDGYTHANISLRHKYEVTYRGLIYSLRDILYYDDPDMRDSLSLFELEQDIFDGHDERSRTRIHQALRRLNIQPLTKTNFQQWVDDVYQTIDGHFEYSEQAAFALREKLRNIDFLT